jgi:transposase
MIRVDLSEMDKHQLENLRRQASAKDSEKILMILLNAEGKSPPEIGHILKRHSHTVRDWLKRYIQGGSAELKRKYSPGRPTEKRDRVIEAIEEVLSFSPQTYGYPEAVWTIPLLAHYLEVERKIKVSDDTIERSLKQAGFSYKRPSKAVSAKAPSKEEKAAAIARLIEKIKALLKEPDWEVYTLDESHFSTEPYLIRGWFKKRWPPSDPGFTGTRAKHLLWLLETKDTKILLEKVSRV